MSAEPAKEAPAAVAPVAETAETTETTTDIKPEATDATEAAAATESPNEETTGVDAVKVEAQPIVAGHLGYKAPGLLKYVH